MTKLNFIKDARTKIRDIQEGISLRQFTASELADILIKKGIITEADLEIDLSV